MTARLQTGMTIDEVIAAFGQPSAGVVRAPGLTHMRYIAPIGSMNAPKEGYIGFEIEFMDGRVKSWRTYRGNPSYAPMTAPPELKWFRSLMWAFFAGAAVYGVFLGIKRRQSEGRTILEAYKTSEIPTRDFPVEFRFVTHDTTVRELIDKAGPYSRQQKFPIDARLAVGGYIYTNDSPARPAIVLLEYDLPFHGAVILIPEYPFQDESRIRAGFYRAPRPEEP